MGGLCVMFGLWASPSWLTFHSIDFVFSGTLTYPKDNYHYWFGSLLAAMCSGCDKCWEFSVIVTLDNCLFPFFSGFSATTNWQPSTPTRWTAFPTWENCKSGVIYIHIHKKKKSPEYFDRLLGKWCGWKFPSISINGRCSTSHERLPACCLELSPI